MNLAKGMNKQLLTLLLAGTAESKLALGSRKLGDSVIYSDE